MCYFHDFQLIKIFIEFLIEFFFAITDGEKYDEVVSLTKLMNE